MVPDVISEKVGNKIRNAMSILRTSPKLVSRRRSSLETRQLRSGVKKKTKNRALGVVILVAAVEGMGGKTVMILGARAR